jgi:hypothetical protein
MKLKNLLPILLVAGIAMSGCVKDEVFKGPPAISNLVLTPQAPGPNDQVTVNIKVTDLNGVSTVKLFYKVESGEYTSITMQDAGQSFYSCQIPAQEGGQTVYYYITADNIVEKLAYHPVGAPETTLAYTVGAPSIVINEIYSRGLPAEPDWVEIYNNSDVTVDISGYKVYDSGGSTGVKEKKQIPAGTVLQPRGFFAFTVDDGEATGFGLSSGGEEIWFESPKGTIIDNVIFPAMDVVQSYGRMPDGSSNWALLGTITKGAANDDSPPVAVIKINEVYSRGITEAPDWLELYNASSFSADISGYKVYDSGGNSGAKAKKEIPAGTTLAAGAFYVIVVDDGAADGFGLSSSGEQVWLDDASGKVIDNVTFPAMAETESYGRFPDGTDNWQLLPTITKGTPNSDKVPSFSELLHYWHFNNLPAGTIVDPVAADSTKAGLGAATIAYPGTGDGYVDQVSPGSAFNTFGGNAAGLGIRFRNPANTREMIIVAPSTGFNKLTLKFAAMRSSSGAAQEELYYSVNGGTNWVKVGDAYDIPLDWELKSFDLTGIEALNNNPNLQFKVLFVGAGADGASGNNRLDNVSIEGFKL